MGQLKMHFLLTMGMFHCYVSLPEGTAFSKTTTLKPHILIFYVGALMIVDACLSWGRNPFFGIWLLNSPDRKAQVCLYGPCSSHVFQYFSSAGVLTLLTFHHCECPGTSTFWASQFKSHLVSVKQQRSFSSPSSCQAGWVGLWKSRMGWIDLPTHNAIVTTRIITYQFLISESQPKKPFIRHEGILSWGPISQKNA